MNSKERFIMMMGSGTDPPKQTACSDSVYLKESWGFNSNQCRNCGVINSATGGFLIQCAKCRKVHYCSSKCFNSHLETHQKECNTDVGLTRPAVPSKTPLSFRSQKEKGQKVETVPVQQEKQSNKKSKKVKKKKAVDGKVKKKKSSSNRSTRTKPETSPRPDSSVSHSEDESTNRDATFSEDKDGMLVEFQKSESSVGTTTTSTCESASAGLPFCLPLNPEKLDSQVLTRRVPLEIEGMNSEHERSDQGYLLYEKRSDDKFADFPVRCHSCTSIFSALVKTSYSDKKDHRSSIHDCTECNVPNLIVCPPINQEDATDALPPRRPHRCNGCDVCVGVVVPADPSSISTSPPNMPTRCSLCEDFSNNDDDDVSKERFLQSMQIDRAPPFALMYQPKPQVAEETLDDDNLMELPVRCHTCTSTFNAHINTDDHANSDGHPTKCFVHDCPECNAPNRVLCPPAFLKDATDESPPRRPHRCNECAACVGFPLARDDASNEDSPSEATDRCLVCVAISGKLGDGELTRKRVLQALQLERAPPFAPGRPKTCNDAAENEAKHLPVRCHGCLSTFNARIETTNATDSLKHTCSVHDCSECQLPNLVVCPPAFLKDDSDELPARQPHRCNDCKACVGVQFDKETFDVDSPPQLPVRCSVCDTFARDGEISQEQLLQGMQLERASPFTLEQYFKSLESKEISCGSQMDAIPVTLPVQCYSCTSSFSALFQAPAEPEDKHHPQCTIQGCTKCNAPNVIVCPPVFLKDATDELPPKRPQRCSDGDLGVDVASEGEEHASILKGMQLDLPHPTPQESSVKSSTERVRKIPVRCHSCTSTFSAMMQDLEGETEGHNPQCTIRDCTKCKMPNLVVCPPVILKDAVDELPPRRPRRCSDSDMSIDVPFDKAVGGETTRENVLQGMQIELASPFALKYCHKPKEMEEESPVGKSKKLPVRCHGCTFTFGAKFKPSDSKDGHHPHCSVHDCTECNTPNHVVCPPVFLEDAADDQPPRPPHRCNDCNACVGAPSDRGKDVAAKSRNQCSLCLSLSDKFGGEQITKERLLQCVELDKSGDQSPRRIELSQKPTAPPADAPLRFKLRSTNRVKRVQGWERPEWANDESREKLKQLVSKLKVRNDTGRRAEERELPRKRRYRLAQRKLVDYSAPIAGKKQSSSKAVTKKNKQENGSSSRLPEGKRSGSMSKLESKCAIDESGEKTEIVARNPYLSPKRKQVTSTGSSESAHLTSRRQAAGEGESLSSVGKVAEKTTSGKGEALHPPKKVVRKTSPGRKLSEKTTSGKGEALCPRRKLDDAVSHRKKLEEKFPPVDGEAASPVEAEAEKAKQENESLSDALVESRSKKITRESASLVLRPKSPTSSGEGAGPVLEKAQSVKERRNTAPSASSLLGSGSRHDEETISLRKVKTETKKNTSWKKPVWAKFILRKTGIAEVLRSRDSKRRDGL